MYVLQHGELAEGDPEATKQGMYVCMYVCITLYVLQHGELVEGDPEATKQGSHSKRQRRGQRPYNIHNRHTQ